jgi:hypothetical protein
MPWLVTRISPRDIDPASHFTQCSRSLRFPALVASISAASSGVIVWVFACGIAHANRVMETY